MTDKALIATARGICDDATPIDFIIGCRNVMPKLIDRVEALQAENAQLRADIVNIRQNSVSHEVYKAMVDNLKGNVL